MESILPSTGKIHVKRHFFVIDHNVILYLIKDSFWHLICFVECSFGGQYWDCPRTMQPMQLLLTRELILHMINYTNNIPSKVGSCWECYKGEWHVYLPKQLFLIRLFLLTSIFSYSSVFTCIILRCRCLSALAHWSPIFGETDFLPMLAFPFVKLFQNNQLVCFEIVATILGKYDRNSNKCHKIERVCVADRKWTKYLQSWLVNLLLLSSQLVSALVWVFSKSTNQHVGLGWERIGTPWQGITATFNQTWSYFPGTSYLSLLISIWVYCLLISFIKPYQVRTVFIHMFFV